MSSAVIPLPRPAEYRIQFGLASAVRGTDRTDLADTVRRLSDAGCVTRDAELGHHDDRAY
jgi:hypothetical protein